MRAFAVHADAIVFVSDVWQTTGTAVRAGEEGFLIDSPVYPEELRALPDVLQQADFPVSGLLCTHGDWDHLLGRLAFPQASLGCPESTAERLQAGPGEAQRQLRGFDEEHYVDQRSPLSLGRLQPLPVPGRLELGPEHELELHRSDGHTSDGAAYWLPWLKVLVCGDYLSPVEIPMISEGGSIEAYRATLARLRPLTEQAAWIVPGHGAPVASERALEILAEDDAYLEQLAGDPRSVKLPSSRSSAAQRRIHETNLGARADNLH
ncbi:MAG TPA: MBL fold metallo-hydrolase [Solirubrobacteraceae bacterium]|jgi:glyoxylase-like metal-dependent hydrolase (beta-lactamase superfamily II)